MSFINEASPVVALPELEVFETIPVQTSIENTFVEEIIPISQLNTGGHIEFIIKTSENEYIRPVDTILQTIFRVKLRRNDNIAITAADWDKISMINNAADSMWSQVDVSIGEVQTTKPLGTYPYKSYFQSLMYHTPEAKKTFLKLRGLTDGDFSEAKKNKPIKDLNKLITWKSGELGIGRRCEFLTSINVDLFQQYKDLIGGLVVKIRLIPSRPEFFFITSDTKLLPTIHFEHIYLHLTQRKISGDVSLGILQGLQISPAKYPINRVEVRTHTIDRGTFTRHLENSYNGTSPRFTLFALVNSAASSGSYDKDPFEFKDYKIGSLSCFLNSELIYRRPIKPDYDLEYLGKPYLNFLKVLGQYNNNILTTITPENFGKGYTIFAFDLTRDNSKGYLKSGYIDPPQKHSHLRFTVQFNEELPETVTAIIYTEWDDIVMVDLMKNALVSNE